MKRYIFSGDINTISQAKVDVAVIGSGVAGLYAAINLDPRLSCIVLNKSGAEESNSIYAQGGIAAVMEKCDDPQRHMEDTLAAGAGLCDEAAVRVLVYEARENIEKLAQLKVPFDLDSRSNFSLTREGGHSFNRILHSGGDATGLHLTKRLLEVAAERSSIKIVHDTFLVDILTDHNGAVAGVVAVDEARQYCFYKTGKVIIASGGIGRIYRNSTNASCSTGDGIASAMRSGADVKDMEFVQFHPTALIHPEHNGRFFLISEALRGEGAVLRNRRWEPFMQGVHPLADLAPRDIVTRAIIREMQKYDLPHVYLDITSKSRGFLQKRFPTIYDKCMQLDIDIAKNWIPVVPIQHYFMGGIKADLFARSNVMGLYACGESACTGVHGANRLASNSLLECIVFGRRAAQDINCSINAEPNTPDFFVDDKPIFVNLDYDSYSTEIREVMTRKCSIIREGKSLNEAADKLAEIYERIDSTRHESAKGYELYNIVTVARAILSASIARKKSVGAHYRSDELEGDDYA